MQLSIELPDQLGQEVLQLTNVQEFVKRVIEKELSAEKKINKIEQELFALMAKIPSSVSLADELIQERRLEARKEDSFDEIIKQKQESEFLIDIVNNLTEIACFKNQNPLEIQKALRDEWSQL